MKKIILTWLILPVFVSAEPWVDYELSEEVIEMTVVTVKPGMKDDYLMGIKKTWVDACKIQKELGHIIGCGVYTANTAGTDPNVFLTIRYENLAAMGPNKEKYNEFTEALIDKEKLKIEEEFGDLLFSLVNYSRHIGIDSNESLKKSTNKFISRYKKLEEIIENKNTNIDKLDENELNSIWEMVKKIN